MFNTRALVGGKPRPTLNDERPCLSLAGEGLGNDLKACCATFGGTHGTHQCPLMRCFAARGRVGRGNGHGGGDPQRLKSRDGGKLRRFWPRRRRDFD